MIVVSIPGEGWDNTTCTEAGSGAAVVVVVDVVVVELVDVELVVGAGATGPHAAASTPTTAIVAAQVSRRRCIGTLPRMTPEAAVKDTVSDY